LRYHAFIAEQSRKAKAARALYEYLRHKVPADTWLKELVWESVLGKDGIQVPAGDKTKVLNIRFHDEQYSPYFKTDMNLFHMLMMDQTTQIFVYRAERGWLFVFDGIPVGPVPFGQHGYDTR
jgi:hypothetical protein